MSHIPGHPAFGTQMFTDPIGPTLSGAPLPSTLLPPSTGGELTPEQFIQFLQENFPELFGGGDGGFAPPAFSTTQAGLQLTGAQALEQLGIQGQQRLDLQGLIGTQGLDIQALVGVQALEELGISGEQAIGLQNLIGQQGLDRQILAGEQALAQLGITGEQATTQIELRERLQLESALAVAKLQGADARALETIRQEFDLKKQERAEKLERQRIFSETFRDNPIQAILFGLGIGGPLVGGGAEALPPLKGIGKVQAGAETALSKTLGRDVQIGREEGTRGVTGLGTAEQAAATFQKGGGATQSLLTSAFGVGDKALGGGLSAQDFIQRIQSVTPTGTLR